MKRIKHFQNLIILLALVVFTQCCKPEDEDCFDPGDPECVNYDPCYGKTEVSADFQFLAKYGFGDNVQWIPETKFVGSPVRFSAIDKEADSYTWYLGLDTITGTDEVELGVNNLEPGSYSASLVLEKEPNLLCFPEDDGRDSLMKFFQVVDFCERLAIGRFRGTVSNFSTDSIDIEIYFANTSTGEMCVIPSSPFFVNVLGDNDTLIGTSAGYGTYSRFMFSGNGSGDLRGEIIVDETTWATTFNYQLGNVDYEFKGRKLE